jgi:hypothetical protein
MGEMMGLVDDKVRHLAHHAAVPPMLLLPQLAHCVCLNVHHRELCIVSAQGNIPRSNMAFLSDGTATMVLQFRC